MDRMARAKKHGERAARSRAGVPHGDLWALAVGLSAVIVYLNAFGNDFVLDDTRSFATTSASDRSRTFRTLRLVVLGPSGAGAVPSAGARHLRGELRGARPVDLRLHRRQHRTARGRVALCFALVRGIGGSLFAAGVAGIAFAVHPVHTEAVTGISGRPELLAAFFFSLAMHFHRLRAGAGAVAIGYRVGMLACFACALLSKESAMTLLLVLPADGRARAGARTQAGRPRDRASRIVTDYLPLVAVAIAYLVVRRAVLGGVVIAEDVDRAARQSAGAGHDDAARREARRDRRAGADDRVCGGAEYARLLVWPARLSPDYSYNQIPLVTSALDVRFLTGVAIARGVHRRDRRAVAPQPVAAFGLALLALTFSIVSNFVDHDRDDLRRAADVPAKCGRLSSRPRGRRLTTVWRQRRRRHRVRGVASSLVLLGGARTWTRNRDWKNESHAVVCGGRRRSRQRPRAVGVRPGVDGTGRGGGAGGAHG